MGHYSLCLEVVCISLLDADCVRSGAEAVLTSKEVYVIQSLPAAFFLREAPLLSFIRVLFCFVLQKAFIFVFEAVYSEI